VSALVQIHERQAKDGKILVGIGDLAISQDRDATIITHALGSCIGVTVYDPVAGVGGLLHFMLPSAGRGDTPSGDKALTFGDVAVPILFKACYEMGAKKERIIVCAAGGAEILDDGGHFKVGNRNRTILRKLFWKNNVLLSSEDTGGAISRTLSLVMGDGAVQVRNKGKVRTLWPE